MEARSDAQIWPEELHALIAASKHHVLLFGNEAVRVLDTRVGPGNSGSTAHASLAERSLYYERERFRAARCGRESRGRQPRRRKIP